MVDLSELISRVEQAMGPDDRLIAEVICAVEGKPFGEYYIGCGDDGSDELQVRTPDDDWVWSGYRHLAPDVSVDAALCLIERVLPGMSGSVRWSGFGNLTQAELYDPRSSPGGGDKSIRVVLDGRNPPLALCLALLRSLHSKGTEG